MSYHRRTVLALPIMLLWPSSRPTAQVERSQPIVLDPGTLKRFRDPRDPNMFRLPAGHFQCHGLKLESGMRLVGAGQGQTILSAPDGVDLPVLTNADRTAGNTDIEIRDLTVDGRAGRRAKSTNGIEMSQVRNSKFSLEVSNCFGTGFLLSGGDGNRFETGMYCHGNGRRGAGYGLYIFGSSNNVVQGGRYDDNCIGIAVEASRIGSIARNNRIVDVICTANRADFQQSGAGIHFEQSDGGQCDGFIENPSCINSTGIGINNTCCALVIRGGRCAANREAGIVTIAAVGINYQGIVCEGNSTGPSTGYRSEMRFDDSGIVPGTSGRVARCRLRGTAPDGGFKTMSTHSAIQFVDNSVEGYRFPYNLHGKADRVS